MLTFRRFAVYRKRDKKYYSNYQVISLFSTAYKDLARRSQCSHGKRRGSADDRLLECRFESRRGHRCLSVVSVVCCYAQFSLSD
jgi:hypothetical protein